MSNYTPFHIHTINSLMDGICKPEGLAKRVKELGYTSCMITDHGNVSGCIKFHTEMKKRGIKPILANEMYVSRLDSCIKNDENRKLDHMVVCAKNKQGWQKLMQITSYSNHPDNFYYKPRLDLNKLEQRCNKEFFIFTGHPGSILYNYLNDYEAAKACIYNLKQRFGEDNVIIELQLFKFTSLDEQEVNLAEVNFLRELAKDTNTRAVACQDIHYVNQQDAILQQIILCSNLGKTLEQIRAMKEKPMAGFFDNDCFYLHSQEELKELGYTDEELDMTFIDEQCESYDIQNQPILPKFCENESELMLQLCRDGWKRKSLVTWDQKVYTDRVKMELAVFDKWDLNGYILIVQDYINWAKKKGMIVNFGRGCLVNTPILYNNEYKDISEITTNNNLINRNGEYDTINNIFSYEIEEEIINIKSHFGDQIGVSLTQDHKVLAEKRTFHKNYFKWTKSTQKARGNIRPVNNLTWIEAKNLEVGDWVFTPWIKYVERNHYIYLSDYIFNKENGSKFYFDKDKNCFLYYKVGNQLSKSKIIEFPKQFEVNEDFAYLLGLFTGDGWFQENNIIIAFGQTEKDKISKEKTIKILNNYKFDFTEKSNYQNKKVDQISIKSYILNKIFKDLFYEYKNKSTQKHIPDCIFTSSKHVIESYINGLVASDGSKKGDNIYIICSTSKKLTYQLKNLLLRIKKPSHIRKDARLSNNNEISNKSHFPHKNTAFYISFYINTPKRVSIEILENGYMSRIRKIEKINYKGLVYDFSINNEQNYTTSSFVVHNSSGGSLVCYLLNVVEVDPIEDDLSFERFFNESRCSPGNISLPDIDTDFPSDGRELVIEYIKEKYGRDNVAQIATFGSLKGKAAIKEVLRTFKVCDFETMNEITEDMPDEAAIADELEEQNEDSIINWCLRNDPKIFKDYCQLDENGKLIGQYAKYFETAIELEGVYKSQGKHAAGVIVTDRPIYELAPIVYNGKNNDPVVALDKKDAEKIGLVKYDILGLGTLTKIKTLLNLLQYGTLDEPIQA